MTGNALTMQTESKDTAKGKTAKILWFNWRKAGIWNGTKKTGKSKRGMEGGNM